MPIVNIYITSGVDRNVAKSNTKNKAEAKKTENQRGESVVTSENQPLNQQPAGCLNITLEIRDNFNGRLLPGTRKHKVSIPLPTQDFWSLRDDWKREYAVWLKQKAKLIKDAPINTDTEIRVSPQTCQNIGNELSAEFNNWFNYQNETKSALREIINPDDYRQRPNDFCFILHTNTGDLELDLFLQRLPSHDWNILQTLCPGAEVSLSTTSYSQLPISSQRPQNILVIVGDDPTIPFQDFKESIDRNIPNDVAKIKYWSCREDDPNTGRRSTRGAIPDLRLTLEDSSPQGIIFIGHSESTLNPSPDGSDLDAPIEIQLNKNDSISLEDPSFQRILRGLKDRGLIFAIFISCDGLRIFPLLNDLGIPYLIVSREILPVDVARVFLDKFLEQAVKPGVPLHIALSRARQYLRNDMEHGIDGCPNASNLLVIGQDPDFPFYILNPASVPASAPAPKSAWEDEIETINKLLKTYKRILIFALILILGLILALMSQRPNLQVSNDAKRVPDRVSADIAKAPESIKRNPDISLGDKPLLAYQDSNLGLGFEYFKAGNYTPAQGKFDEYLLSHKNSPEILIASNNSFVAKQSKINNQKPLRIATGVPLIGNIPVAREILSGIAMYQKKAIADGTLLQVVIGRDDNKGLSAKKIAQAFVDEPSILGAIGHNASEASVAAKDIYSGKMVMLSPTSFDPQLSNIPYIYRMVSQMDYFATQLQKYIDTSFKASGKISHPAICLDPDSPDNEAFKIAIIRLAKAGGTEYKELKCDKFKDMNSTKIKEIVKEIQESESNAIIVAPHINSIGKAMLLLKEIKRIPNVQLFGSPSFYTHVAENAGVDDLIVSAPYFPANPKDLFGKEYDKMWGEELNNWRTPMAYASTMVMTETLKNLSSREGLNKILSDKNNKQVFSTGVIDSFHFNGSHELQYEKLSSSEGVLIKLKGQKFRLLERLSHSQLNPSLK
jgi:branched-chain amino acid transport system substrate-binding protein